MTEPVRRAADIARKTGETDIKLSFALDGTGETSIETDVPFLSHMLELFAKHGHFDLKVQASGDVEVDDHHTVEDIGICLGRTILEALGDKRGIRRYANVFIPMDEALAQVVIDISNRPHLEYRAEYPAQTVGSFHVELVHEFLWKLALEARITLHVIVHYGRNTHHMIEAVFKALGRALDEASSSIRACRASRRPRECCNSMIAIIDYGMGNLHSVSKAVERLGHEAKVTTRSRGDPRRGRRDSARRRRVRRRDAQSARDRAG